MISIARNVERTGWSRLVPSSIRCRSPPPENDCYSGRSPPSAGTPRRPPGRTSQTHYGGSVSSDDCGLSLTLCPLFCIANVQARHPTTTHRGRRDRHDAPDRPSPPRPEAEPRPNRTRDENGARNGEDRTPHVRSEVGAAHSGVHGVPSIITKPTHASLSLALHCNGPSQLHHSCVVRGLKTR